MDFGLPKWQKVHEKSRRQTSSDQHGQHIKHQGSRLNPQELSPVPHETRPLSQRLNIQPCYKSEYNSSIQPLQGTHFHRSNTDVPF